MDKRMTLRDGKQIRTEEGSEEEQEERRHGMGDFQVQYLEQGRHSEDHDDEREVSGRAEPMEELEETRRSRENIAGRYQGEGVERRQNEQTGMMEMLQQLFNNQREEIRGDMNTINRKFDNLRGDMNNQREEIRGDMNTMNTKLDQNKEEIKREMKTNSQRMEEKIENMRKQLEESRSYTEERIQETKQEIRDEMLGRLMEVEEIQSREMENIKKNENELKMEIGGNSKKIEINIEKIKKLDREIMKTNKTIQDMEEEMNKEVGYIKLRENTNEEAMKMYQENIEKTIKDLDGKMTVQTEMCVNRSQIMGNQFNQELEEMNRKLQDTKEELEDNIRRNGGGMIYTGNVEIGVKFDGNINIIHPKVFMKIMKSKMKGIRDMMEKKILIRGMLSGHALLWFCNKEEQIRDMEEFEMQFLTYFWGEIQQANFRERLYFGKFDYNKSKNLNTYAMQLYNMAQYLEPAMKEEELVLYVGRHFNAEVAETIALHNIKTMDNLSSYLQRVERSIQNGNGIHRYQREIRNEDTRNDRQRENGNGFVRRNNHDRNGNIDYGYRNGNNRRYQGNEERGDYNDRRNSEAEEKRTVNSIQQQERMGTDQSQSSDQNFA